MKCIRCSTDNNLKDRTGNQGQCKNCQHPFAFEPTAMGKVKVTDPMFAKAIADLSANNTLFYTSKQFLYFLDKRFKKKESLPPIGCFILYLFLASIGTITLGGVLLGETNSILALFAPALAVSILAITILFRMSNSRKSNYKSRQSSAKLLVVVGGIVLVVGIIASVAGDSFSLFAISVLLGVGSLYLGIRQRRNRAQFHQDFTVDPAQLQGWLDRWQQVNGSANNLLPPVRESGPAVRANPDVTAYSFDRLVVCNSATIAHLLIANNFHFENNCAILSITGYPQSIFDTAMTMLRRNSELKVYAFHDCSPTGVNLVHQLRTSPTWFQDSPVEIFDVGLLPRQVLPNKSLFVQNTANSKQSATQIPTTVRSSLTNDEITWLEAGNFVELESFTPKQLIQILNRGIAGSRELEGGDSGLILVGDDYGSSYYVVDSFG